MSGNPFGVVIPPNKGDANHEGACACGHPVGAMDPTDRAEGALTYCPRCSCWDHWPPEAPTTPHAPASPPNTDSRAELDAPTRSDPHRSNP